jgi:ribosomal protein S18 acetylase RimI-like enzyme
VTPEPLQVDRVADLPRMQAIIAEALAADPRYVIHPGDLAWWVYHEDPRIADQVSYWIWEGAATLVLGVDEINVFATQGAPIEDLIEWAQAKVGGTGVVAGVSSVDEGLIRYLRGAGYHSGSEMFQFEWDLDRREVPRPVLPPGWVLRPVSGEGEAMARRTASHLAFRSTMTDEEHLERYLRFMRSPVYVPERDLVAVAPDGTIASFMVWWADDSGIAQIEPFGTHPEYQGRGIGRALIHHGLRQMSDSGMRLARVCTEVTRDPASRFYPGVGFDVVGRLVSWTPPSSEPASIEGGEGATGSGPPPPVS